MIYVECKPDKLLVQMLTGWPGREIIHENDQYRVMKTLSRQQGRFAKVQGLTTIVTNVRGSSSGCRIGERRGVARC